MRTLKLLISTLALAMIPGALAAQLPVPAQNFPFENILVNPGFENGSYGWTASGGATKVANATAKAQGSFGYDWDSNSAAQTLLSNSITIPAYLYGRDGVVYCSIKTPSGTATHTMTVNDGTSDIITAQTITSSTSFARTAINFVFPTSGTIRLKFASVASNEPEIYIDTCYLGEVNNVGQYSQITPWVSYTPTVVGMGTLALTEVQSRRVGDTLEVKGKLTSGTATGSTITIALGFNGVSGNVTAADTSKIPSIQACGVGVSNVTAALMYTILCTPSLGTFGVGVQSSGAAGLTAITGTTFSSAATMSFFMKVPILGWQADTVYRPDSPGVQWTSYTPTLTGNISGTFTNQTTTGFYRCDGDTLEMSVESVFSGAPGTATGYFQWSLPSGFTADTTKILTTSVGQQAIGFGQGLDNGTSWYRSIVQYQDTTHFTAIMSDTGNQVAPATPFTWGSADLMTLYARVPVTAGSPCSRVRAPVLVGSVTNNSSGAERIERAVISFSGGPFIASQSGSWLSSVTNSGTGDSTLNFTSKMFSSPPTCVVTPVGAGAVYTFEVAAVIVSAVEVKTRNSAGTLANQDFMIICMGPR